MSQQLNLVNPALLPPKPFFQFRSMMLALAVLVGVLVFFSFFITSQVRSFEEAAALSAQRLAAKQTQIAALEQKSGTRVLSPAVAEEQASVEAEKRRLEELGTQIAQLGGLRTVRSRADILFALAQRPATGLWLTGIDIVGERMAFEGMTLQAANLPRWLGELQTLTVFAGQRFGGIEIKPVEVVAQSAPAAGQSAGVSVLAFSLTAEPAEKKP
ncbi:hypothetical protein VVD49_10125 [Uliginosibacterium sp. H3]|uniref:Uncharacterized protein n=1 Tax=Uliginosibacterium silvisoli TaxID=3114758 RepID=A0ABU6K4V8_9RHOO|nr:hypothetical protein [Uliginosibacterium sp. H3]